MDDGAGEAGGESQVHVCSSHPLSFPSQPPDIKNWFSSYVYDSPEVPELVADHNGGNGSETQDPFEDGGVALRENCLGGESEPEIFSGKYLVPVDGNVMKPAPKRKQSLRALFGASFLYEAEEATETESHGLFPVQLNALKHVSDRTSLPLDEICEAHSEKKDCAISLPDSTRHSQEGTTEHNKVLVDCDRISSADTQESTPADEVESKKSSNCYDACLADIGDGFAEDDIHHIELPVSFNSTILAGTDKKIQDGVDNSTSLVSRNSLSLADTEDNSPLGENDSEENSPSGLGRTDNWKPSLDSIKPQEIVASDGFIAVKRKKLPDEHKTNKIPRHPMGREKEKGNLQESGGISDQKVFVQEQTRRPLADRTNFSEVNTAPAPEPSRKWKCPRKGKPYVGRPMKQLRLEQWVRRIN
ncbi:hypothetical protein BDA96_06G214900 [Sorghum bicolor]|uniref:Uncharacterized protein n=2 Tax=Sorghum bicolor TaxID=4558 RepID=A0A921QT90_SORBI|nr:uncharacterized protein LOC8071076 [Sorghum bicolor]KAG0527223.1 hypothetical protein BDA96_06G214900 [Sorghum bicolor]KXG27013.1 hypothetical protein SORBI_3006G196600 [Sorghum bicolor]|eukprot:XP_021318462.1 uncharacterized protein LOC8071076 [Sorghum bicolor]